MRYLIMYCNAKVSISNFRVPNKSNIMYVPCHRYHRLGLGKYFLEFIFNKDGLFSIIFTAFVIVVIVMRLMFKKRKYLWRTSTKTYLFFASPDWDNWCGLQCLWILTQCPNGWYWMMLLLLKQEKCRISIFYSN